MSVTDGVAIYAAAVATLTLVWNIVRHVRTSSPNAKVAFIQSSWEVKQGTKPDVETIQLSIMNRGQRPILLRTAGFQLSNGENL